MTDIGTPEDRGDEAEADDAEGHGFFANVNETGDEDEAGGDTAGHALFANVNENLD